MIPDGFDFTDPDLYAERIPVAEFAELRRTAPVWWNAQPHNLAGFDDDGYWVVSRHAEVKEVSRDPEVFSSAENTAVVRFNSDMTREKIQAQRLILLNIDPPQHSKVRGIVSRGFTPKSVSRLRDALAERAARIVHAAKPRAVATSSPRWRASCRCRRSPSRSGSRRRTGTRSSTGPTR